MMLTNTMMTARASTICQSLRSPLKEKQTVNHAAQRRRNRKAGEIRPGRLEQEAQNVTHCALNGRRDGAKQHRCWGKCQMRQRDF